MPVASGDYKVKVTGEVCAGETDCDPNMSGVLNVEVKLGKQIRLKTGFLEGKIDWATACDGAAPRYAFDQATFTLKDVGSSIALLTPQIPIVVFGVWIGYAQLGGQIEASVGSSSIIWKSNFPGWPDEALVAYSVGGGLVGIVDLGVGLLVGKATAIINVQAEYRIPPGTFDPKGWCFDVKGEGSVFWGIAKGKWRKHWGPGCAARAGAPLPRVVESERDRLMKAGSSLLADDVPVYEEIEYAKQEFTGTGSVYEGSALLGDISADLYDDGLPAVAKNASGEILVVWTKDVAASNLGASAYASTHDGAAWAAPVVRSLPASISTRMQRWLLIRAAPRWPSGRARRTRGSTSSRARSRRS